MNAQNVDRTAPHFCHSAVASRRAWNQAESTAKARPRPTPPFAPSSPATLAPNAWLNSAVLPHAVAGLSNAFRRVGGALGRYTTTITLLVLAALLVVPMPATPQGQGLGDCIENCPVFSSTATPHPIPISEHRGLGEEIDVLLPTATDVDQPDGNLVYSLWDSHDPIENGDRNEAGFGDDDAAAFDLEKGYDYENGELKANLALKTNAAYDYETKRVYKFRLVACDDDYNRAYIDITVEIIDVDEPPDAPSMDSVTGASPSELVVRWSPPDDNSGRPPITSYDLQWCPASGQCPTEPQAQVSGWTNGPQNVQGTKRHDCGIDGGHDVQDQGTGDERRRRQSMVGSRGRVNQRRGSRLAAGVPG